MTPDTHHPQYGRRSSDQLHRALVADSLNGRSRLAYVLANGFEALLALAAAISALVSFVHPDALTRSNLAAFHPWDTYWNALYLAGGLFVITGLFVNRSIWAAPLLHYRVAGYGMELAGLVFLAGAFLVEVLAILKRVGFTLNLFTFLALALACGVRGRALIGTRGVTVAVEAPIHPAEGSGQSGGD